MDDFLIRVFNQYPILIKIISRVTWLRQRFSNYYINRLANSTQPRPRAFSLASPYTSWKSLTDKTFTGRHLPESDKNHFEPEITKVVELWRRQGKEEILSTDTSMLFSFFAQWFTDSFLRTDFRDRRKNTSNHEIDLCQIYGLTEKATNILRSKQDGKLKQQIINGEIYPPYLFNVEKTTLDNWVFADEDFESLHPRHLLDIIFNDIPEQRLKHMFAVGLEHGNSAIGQTTLNTIMLREHNRLCDLLKKDHPLWDDERLFQTTRNIMIVLLLRIIIHDYVGHISQFDFPFDPSIRMPEKNNWYRNNWISLEFNLLYRWHSMVPEIFSINTSHFKQDNYRNNTLLVIQHGVGTIITAASQQKAGRIGLKNTPNIFFEPLPIINDNRSVMERTVQMARDANLQSFNDYCVAFKLPRLNNFKDLTDDPQLQYELEQLYNNKIDDLEWHVGIFAEKHLKKSMLGKLMTRMVAYDAFTHALTNPLLSKNVFNEKTFSNVGLSVIRQTNTLENIIKRNTTDSVDVVANFKYR